ncbi:MAG: Protein of unknown function precursor containing a C-terminal secretion signal [Pedosphaera sp.]|nr:Protein of unknown function precursor containing a C-terminal secretion signal [Pedosphaera sp.]
MKCITHQGASMKKFLLFFSLSSLTVSAFALPDYESFSDATGAGGTSYNTGDNLAGQKDAGGQSWFLAGVPGSSPQPTIANGDLIVPGLYSAGGGHSAAFGGNGNNARLNLSVGAGGITAGTVYFSFAMKLTDISTLTTGGIFWAGYNNSQGAQSTVPNTVATRVVTRASLTTPGAYNIGLDKSLGTPANFVWASGEFTTASTVFIVGSYTFNTSSGSDDVSQLWINPNSSDFGAASAPGGSLSSTSGNDLVRVASFTLYNRNANEPAGGLIDDLRFGLNWADVTPAVPEPTTITLGALGLVMLGLSRFLRKASKN